MYLFANRVKNCAVDFIDFRLTSILLTFVFYALINGQFAQTVRGKFCQF